MSALFPIHHTFGPLVTDAQWKLAFALQWKPWKWKDGPEREELRGALVRSFGANVALFGSGRDSLLAALRALELKAGEEVILQGYTCIVVPNAIHAAGGLPVYADINPETLNLDLEKLQSKITPRTRAIICQHTFGIPFDTRRLRAICDKRHLALIEDAAHVIPDGGTKGDIGTFGDILFFSFGRDKAISGVTGGAVLTRHGYLADRLKRMEDEAVSFSHFQIMNFLGYPLRYRFAKMIWRTGLAKAYLHALRSFKLLPPVLTNNEKEGRMEIIPKKLPNACAALALEQFRSLQILNDHRRTLTALYQKSAEEQGWHFPSGIAQAIALQKFPLFVKDAAAVRAKLKQEEIYLDDGWNSAVVNPPSVSPESAGYMTGSCPRAEEVTKHILMLPTHPTVTSEQAKYLIHALVSHLQGD